jgi:hypothetical protein
MFYYTYITTLKDSDKYYVGRHQSKYPPEKDQYMGSGKWVKSIKDRSRLKRTVLEFYTNEKELTAAERILLGMHMTNPNCMNMNENPTGFSSENNWRKTPEGRENSRQLFLLNNPTRGKSPSQETLEKMRIASTGRPKTKETREKLRLAMLGRFTGKIWTDEQRQRLSETRKEEYRSGSRTHARGMAGKNQSEISKEKMRKAQQNRNRSQYCEHCERYFALCAFIRWHGEHCKLKV